MTAAVSFRRMAERHPEAACVRTALLARGDLPVTLRHKLIEGLSDALGKLVTVNEWMCPQRIEKVRRESLDRAAVELSRRGKAQGLRDYASLLIEQDRLSPALLLRAACLGSERFYEAALCVLSKMPEKRALALMYDKGGSGFATIYRRTGLPMQALPAFRAVQDTLRAAARDECEIQGTALMDGVIARHEQLSGGIRD